MKFNRIGISLFACILISCVCYNKVNAQTINLGGTIVEVNKIPLGKPLHIEETASLKSTAQSVGSTQVKVFKSSNNKFFITSITTYTSKKSLNSSCNGIEESEKSISSIAKYDLNGNRQWEEKLVYNLKNSFISDDGTKCYAIVYDYASDRDYEKLILFDNEGKREREIENVGNVYFNKDKDIYYYLKDEKGVRYLGYSSNTSNSNWEIPIDKDGMVTSVSSDGSNVIICSPNGLFSYGSDSKLKWKNPNLKGIRVSLSDKGNFVMQCQNTGVFHIYDNANGDLIRSIKSFDINGNRVNPYWGCFIEGANDKFLIMSLFENRHANIGTSIVSIFDNDFNLVKNKLVQDRMLNSDLKSKLDINGKVHVFYNGFLVADISIDK